MRGRGGTFRGDWNGLQAGWGSAGKGADGERAETCRAEHWEGSGLPLRLCDRAAQLLVAVEPCSRIPPPPPLAGACKCLTRASPWPGLFPKGFACPWLGGARLGMPFILSTLLHATRWHCRSCSPCPPLGPLAASRLQRGPSCPGSLCLSRPGQVPCATGSGRGSGGYRSLPFPEPRKAPIAGLLPRLAGRAAGQLGGGSSPDPA